MSKSSLLSDLNCDPSALQKSGSEDDMKELFGAYRALLIATGRLYDDDDGKFSLDGVDSDVELIREILVDKHCGFQEEDVKVLKTDNYPKFEKINKALDNLLNSCGENDFVFLYFSGHGFHDSQDDSDYFVPHDVKFHCDENGLIDSYRKETCYSFKLLREKIDACHAKFVWVVVDACRVNGTSFKGDFHKYPFESIGKLEATKSSLWFQSCGIGQKSEECKGLDPDDQNCSHSCFTWFFCEGAKGEAAKDNGIVTPNKLFRYVCEKLKDNCLKQTPMRSCKEESIGECCFVDFSDKPEIQVKKIRDEISRLLEDEQYERALEVVTRALESDPNNKEEYREQKERIVKLIVPKCLTQSQDFWFGGNYDEALREVNRALQLDPKNESARKLKKRVESAQGYLVRAWNYYAFGKYDKALQCAKHMLDFESENESVKSLMEELENNSPKGLPKKWLIDYSDSRGKEYRLIEVKSFMMGSPLTGEEIVTKYSPKFNVRNCSDAPQHKVILTQDFYLAKHPVTKGEFQQFVDEMHYQTTAEKEGSAWILTKDGWKDAKGKSWRDPGFEQTDNHPVVCMSYLDVLEYINWLNKTSSPDTKLNGFTPYYRLLTESEWEYACRAGTTTEYFWGDEAKDGKDYLSAAGTEKAPNGKTWMNHFPFDMSYSTTAPVGSFKPNSWGLFDMLGNVWEWTSDWYGDYPEETANDPKGVAEGEWRVLRGGGWCDCPANCRCSFRDKDAPSARDASCGMRVAFSLMIKKTFSSKK